MFRDLIVLAVKSAVLAATGIVVVTCSQEADASVSHDDPPTPLALTFTTR